MITHVDPLVKRFCDELISGHGAHTIVLYGSRADGSAGPSSDYDLAAFAAIPATVRDARLVDGAFLDAFVYPESVLASPTEAHLGIRGGKVLVQRGAEADTFLAALEALFAKGPKVLPPDEIEALKVWAVKMLGRMKRGDVEGDYRRTWLLTALLEDYFLVRGAWYLGPKRSLRWLERFDAPAHSAFCAALKPGATHDDITALVRHVIDRELP